MNKVWEIIKEEWQQQCAAHLTNGTHPTFAEVKPVWVAALRSGEYIQGAGALCQRLPGEDTKMYCCLGVLADLVAPCFGLEKSQSDLGHIIVTAYDDEVGELPLPIADAFFGGEQVPGTLYEKRFIDLIGANDAGVPFVEIADVIEGAQGYGSYATLLSLQEVRHDDTDN